MAQTLDFIESLPIQVVIPGHGSPFADMKTSLAVARSRLDYLASDPQANIRHGAKVLLKYRLLEWRSKDIALVREWIAHTPALITAAKMLNMNMNNFTEWLLNSLVKTGAAKLDGNVLVDLV